MLFHFPEIAKLPLKLQETLYFKKKRGLGLKWNLVVMTSGYAMLHV
jgi:hypothetical protein